jgi:hypothetical protein
VRLILDISRTADGHVTGQAQVPGERAVPFTGLLELFKAIEDALLGTEQTEPAAAQLNMLRGER